MVRVMVPEVGGHSRAAPTVAGTCSQLSGGEVPGKPPARPKSRGSKGLKRSRSPREPAPPKPILVATFTMRMTSHSRGAFRAMISPTMGLRWRLAMMTISETKAAKSFNSGSRAPVSCPAI